MRAIDTGHPRGTGVGIMMFGQGRPVKVFVATRPVDFRKDIDGLALAVQEMFGLGPFCGAVFVFRSKRADRVKLLMWDRTGMVLVHKRLEGGKFVWPQVQDGVMRMSSAQLAASKGWTGGWFGRSGRGVLCSGLTAERRRKALFLAQEPLP